MGAIVDQLRSELAASALRDADTCPSWPRYVRELRADGEAELAEALALALDPRGRGPEAARAVTRWAIESADGPLALWRGEGSWSWWLGPFVLALIGDDDILDSPLARLLLPQRVFTLQDAIDWTAAIPSGGVVPIPTTMPGEHPSLLAHMRKAAAAVHGAQAADNDAVNTVHEHAGMFYISTAPPAPSGRQGVIDLGVGQAQRSVHIPAIAQLERAVLIGPPELLSACTDVEHQPWHEPAPRFEDRLRLLAEPQPALLGCLRDELAARSLSEAHTCPSWSVLLDWSLSEGRTSMAAWLRAELDVQRTTNDAGSTPDAVGERMLSGPLAPASRRVGQRLAQLWARRGSHVRWFGPFVLAYFDPELDHGIGALELQTVLGVHASLLARERVYTRVDADWINHALTPSDRPKLAPMPTAHATGTIAGLIRRNTDEGLQRHVGVRTADPGEALQLRPERAFATNIGYIAADGESIGMLCCESLDDIERHAAAWDRIQNYEHVIILAPPELLERWPHGGVLLPPWPA